MVSSPVAATKLLFADHVHTDWPVAESATTKSYRWPLGKLIVAAFAVGFFTVNVSVTSPLTVAESDAGSSLLGRTTTGGCGIESIGVVHPVSHGKLSIVIDRSAMTVTKDGRPVMSFGVMGATCSRRVRFRCW